MTRIGKNFRAVTTCAAVIACLAIASACDSNNNPNSPPPSANAPVIASIGPNQLVVGGSTQTITITGSRFVAGLTILLDAPNGVWTTYSGDAITVQSSTQFTAKVMLDKTGVWDVTVHNPDGSESNEVQFTVVAAAQ